MLRRADDENVDSGADTAGSDFSRMSSSGIDFLTRRLRQQRQLQLLVMNLHLLANPGDSLLLQHTLDRLLRWLCPSLRIFHVSERASPFRSYTHPFPVAGYPSIAITFFLHEAYGEERILKVLDFFRRPPWQYHHTESCGTRTGGIHITSDSSSSNPLMRPYLLPSRDFYSLGAGMPVWGVRPVHCGGEILRVTLYSGYENYEDAVRLYETVLQRQAEEQKAGFCWFTLHNEPGLSLQLALKQLSPGEQVEPSSSAVLQFSVEEIGQLVPLLPNPCTPISSARWQTEDLDGNKVLFQVKTPAQPQRPLTCAFPLSCPSTSPHSPGPGHSVSSCSLSTAPSWLTHKQGHRWCSEPVCEKLQGDGAVESVGSGSVCSTPPGSSCYSSQRSSPAPLSSSPMHRSVTRSISHLLLEEDESETNVDTGAAISPRHDSAVKTITRSSSLDFLRSLRSERSAAVGGSAVEELVKELSGCLPRTHIQLQASSKTWTRAAGGGCYSRTGPGGQNASLDSSSRTITHTNKDEMIDEFFI
ncbi:protein FAM124B-like [Gouania willdenowi]|uniref:Protein FAM124B-like n=1 Tax=Gouania willdenowi TaxID=441366 RepID=A0A8C5GG86_GOUWI|nr:protein FAM124B-like [Gouania willdenowi]